MYEDNLNIWFHRSKDLSNQHCLYCGRYVGSGSALTSNKEHLIARSFVPKGSFGDGNGFNFIFRSCVSCNNEKSKLEGHISAVSLYGTFERENDPRIDQLAEHKASKEFYPGGSRKTIKDSEVKGTIEIFAESGFPELFEISGPPPALDRYIRTLSFLHVGPLYSLSTQDISVPFHMGGIRILKPDCFFTMGAYVDSDWGNPQLQYITKLTQSWTKNLRIHTSNGFFKAVLKSDPTTPTVMFWALEWNKYYRVAGFICLPEDMERMKPGIPKMEIYRTTDREGREVFLRREIRQSAETDSLFSR